MLEDEYEVTPLMCAAAKGHTAILHTLLAHGARFSDEQSGRPSRPWDFAVRHNHMEAVKLLIKHCKDREYPKTAFLIAAAQGNLEMAKLLYKKVGTVDRESATPHIDIEDRFGRTPLIWASLYGQGEMVRWLLQRGCDVHHADHSGTTALAAAVHKRREDVIELLLRETCDSRCSGMCTGGV